MEQNTKFSYEITGFYGVKIMYRYKTKWSLLLFSFMAISTYLTRLIKVLYIIPNAYNCYYDIVRPAFSIAPLTVKIMNVTFLYLRKKHMSNLCIWTWFIWLRLHKKLERFKTGLLWLHKLAILKTLFAPRQSNPHSRK